MRTLRRSITAVAFAVAIAFAGSSPALAATPDPNGLPAGSELTSVGGVKWQATPAYAVTGTEGHWLAGCRYSAINAAGWTIFSVTIWQEYKAIYTPVAEQKITYWPAEYFTSKAYYGWVLTSSSHSHWKIDSKTGVAQVNYTMTQYVAGQPYQSHSGFVQVTVKAAGTWSCRGA